ncbi:hypothetical protein [Alphabaculovirus altersperidaniae]|uniref:Uncharacterized protein n=1 Tax=Spodoptera eridania nucleopolyhedrovirus TaxID=2315721 RepID=A0ABX6TR02_9ABAC|nr:hypothetical protein QKS47_gp033 [Spodoptera eridania nucleopolyhedrovirus]QNV47787.1 hypothetical protein [Spodoptera eridania nucleopolyhedrovirus]
MLVDKFALSTINMYDKIDLLTNTLNDLRRFVETHVKERDYMGYGYESRDKFVDDVVDAVVLLHLNNETCKSKLCRRCGDDGENFNTLASRRLVDIHRYKCKNCGTINNFCSTLCEKPINYKENNNDDKNDCVDENNTNIDDVDEDNKTNNRSQQVRRNAILFISKWTIFKLVTELFLWARCWFWGYCEKPWYILWNRKNKILTTNK